MTGNLPTVRERLDQILRYKLPHVVRVGNTLGSENRKNERAVIFEGSKSNHGCSASNTLIGVLDGHVPEFTLGMSNVPGELVDPDRNKFWIRNSYADAIVNAMGVESYAKSKIVSGEVLKSELLECHAFYDPTTDTTHYFILPKKE